VAFAESIATTPILGRSLAAVMPTNSTLYKSLPSLFEPVVGSAMIYLLVSTARHRDEAPTTKLDSTSGNPKRDGVPTKSPGRILAFDSNVA
jgi:hypothetical protein